MCSFIASVYAWNAKPQELVFVAMPMICQQFRRLSNLFGDCGACGVWPTKSFHPMLLWPLCALSRVILARAMSNQLMLKKRLSHRFQTLPNGGSDT